MVGKIMNAEKTQNTNATENTHTTQTERKWKHTNYANPRNNERQKVVRSEEEFPGGK